MILMKAYPSNSSIIKKTVTFPSGKEICLGSMGMGSYIVTSKEELDFLSKQRDIQLMKPTEREVVQYLESLPEIPVVGTIVENPKQFDPSEADENMLKDELVKRGFNVEKVSGIDSGSSYVEKVSDTALVTEFAKRYRANPELAKSVGIEFSENNKELEQMSFDELKQALSKLGYSGLRKKG